MFKIISLIGTALFLVAGVALGVLNPQLVTIDLFWFQQTVALSVVMAVVFIAGMLMASVIMLFQVTRLKWRLSQKKRECQKQADQVVQLKKTHARSLSALDKNRNALIQNDK
ncbi:LapA family protein [Thiomicrorhabdus sp. ZW0627]|uniref:LapA family protein n=1 Tax=Thiomicrorhabdus sp. ZW0627 TaxID=3039774 RepID=UPI002436B984|nr:LapA family protein [Thiomicrorhabdus sp. ZW0627]MDG6772909.1 LapA family protein [Thiomicrorhabdus sp. ZW0627]